MKIEIEFGEVEILRDTIFKQEEEIKQLKEQLSLLDEKLLQDKAISLSFRLFETYIAAVFQRLGLEPMHGESVRIPDSLNHYLGTEWWRRGRLEIILGANVTSRFKKAFLNLGIISKEDMPNEVNFENDPPKVVSVVYEPNQETFKEDAEKYYIDNIFCDGITEFEHDIAIRCYIAGAKNQAENMYSEEEVIAIVEKIRETRLKQKYTQSKLFELYVQQFKKKQSGE
jgi:hypothetical protein